MKCKCLLLIDFITLSLTVPVTYVKTESHKIVLIVPQSELLGQFRLISDRASDVSGGRICLTQNAYAEI